MYYKLLELRIKYLEIKLRLFPLILFKKNINNFFRIYHIYEVLEEAIDEQMIELDRQMKLMELKYIGQ